VVTGYLLRQPKTNSYLRPLLRNAPTREDKSCRAQNFCIDFRDYPRRKGFLSAADFMRQSSQRTRTIIALSCCCILSLAATAHLLHFSHTHHKHGKNIAALADLLGALSLPTIAVAFYVPPALATLLTHWRSSESVYFGNDGSLEVQIGRAPPTCV
jgi:hypothetical protein